jgi:hypothetical protein
MSRSHLHLILNSDLRIRGYRNTIFGSAEHCTKEHLIDEDELAEGEEGAGPHPHLLDPPLTRTVEL